MGTSTSTSRANSSGQSENARIIITIEGKQAKVIIIVIIIIIIIIILLKSQRLALFSSQPLVSFQNFPPLSESLIKIYCTVILYIHRHHRHIVIYDSIMIARM